MQTSKTTKRLKGFTLVEVVIVAAVVVLITVCIFGICILSQKFYTKAENRAEILQNGRIILERLSREVRQANAIVSQLPQSPDVPENPPLNEIEFEDGHTPSPYDYLGSDYFYIRYYLLPESQEARRQYRVYCFEPCGECASYVRWNEVKMVGEEQITPLPCVLEDRAVGEYVSEMSFWGSGLINFSLKLAKKTENIELNTQIAGRNF